MNAGRLRLAAEGTLQRHPEKPAGATGRYPQRTGSAAACRTWRSGPGCAPATPRGRAGRMRRRPPHILVTTPESLYILLTSDSGRKLLATVRSVIVDEIHALAPATSAARTWRSLWSAWRRSGGALQRIGLSATQKPIEEVAHFLRRSGGRRGRLHHHRYGARAAAACIWRCRAHRWQRSWRTRYGRSSMTASRSSSAPPHHTDIRQQPPPGRAGRAASRRAHGRANVTAHHGSLARAHRLDAEQRLKSGELKALVATASLELGIDIGDVDLVCQLGSPRSISSFLQRVGRSGHAVGATPEGRLFPLSRDDLVDCAALLDSVRAASWTGCRYRTGPWTCWPSRSWPRWPARNGTRTSSSRCSPRLALSRPQPGGIPGHRGMLADGFATRRGRRGAYPSRWGEQGCAAGGAPSSRRHQRRRHPGQFDYDVILSPAGHRFAQRGLRLREHPRRRVPAGQHQLPHPEGRAGRVLVEDAKGMPPNIPFWFGEAPARTDELSQAVSRLRAEADRLAVTGGRRSHGLAHGRDGRCGGRASWRNISRLRGLGTLPTQDQVVFERFFDEAGDKHLVIHSPFGARSTAPGAWRCASASAASSISSCRRQPRRHHRAVPRHPTVSPWKSLQYLNSATRCPDPGRARRPMFGTRWRWVATPALAVRRNRSGQGRRRRSSVPTEDLVADFPGSVGLRRESGGRARNAGPPAGAPGDCRLPDRGHGLRGAHRLLTGSKPATSRRGRDLTEPSPLAQEILAARPYAFLDDAPLEERRTQAVMIRRGLEPEEAADLGRSIPRPSTGCGRRRGPRPPMPMNFTMPWCGWASSAPARRRVGRAGRLSRRAGAGEPGHALKARGRALWVAAERWLNSRRCSPGRLPPRSRSPPARRGPAGRGDGTARSCAAGSRARAHHRRRPRRTLGFRGLGCRGLAALEAEGFVRGRFTPGPDDEWCERRLLARIHRYTLERLRARSSRSPPAISCASFWLGSA